MVNMEALLVGLPRNRIYYLKGCLTHNPLGQPASHSLIV